MAAEAIATLFRRLRHAMWKGPPGHVDYDTFQLACAAGRVIESMMGTDRDRSRPIPKHVWDALPDDARRLLRLARVEGIGTRAYDELASPRLTAWVGTLPALYASALLARNAEDVFARLFSSVGDASLRRNWPSSRSTTHDRHD
jgi:hypothetical protein